MADRSAQDDALDSMRRQEAEGRQLCCWVVIGFAEQDVVAQRSGNRADPSHQLRKEGVGDVRDDDTYQSRRLHAQPLRNSRWCEAQLRRSFLDARLERCATKLVPLTTFETVVVDTRARRATSLIVVFGKVRPIVQKWGERA